MSAIAVHHTETDDGAWDGPANEARLKADAGEAYYKSAFAWQDPDGDPETKAAYKFPHHLIDEEGNVGAANVKACQTGCGVLNGGMGGAKIPDADRQGVYNHLAAHLKDADVEPPDLRAGPVPVREERSFPLREMRVISDNGERKIVGYAAVFDQLSVELWGFWEKIAPGAFTKTIQEADVRGLWNHDSNYVLGRTKSGTLALREDPIGLGIEILPPDTQWARDLMVTIDRGDVDQMSFAFQVMRDRWETIEDKLVRTLEEVALYDVSPVTFPAYPQTTVQLRGDLRTFGVPVSELPEFVRSLERIEKGMATRDDLRMLRAMTDRVQKEIPAAPAQGSHPADEDAEGKVARARHALRRRVLELQLLRKGPKS